MNTQDQLIRYILESNTYTLAGVSRLTGILDELLKDLGY